MSAQQTPPVTVIAIPTDSTPTTTEPTTATTIETVTTKPPATTATTVVPGRDVDDQEGGSSVVGPVVLVALVLAAVIVAGIRWWRRIPGPVVVTLEGQSLTERVRRAVEEAEHAKPGVYPGIDDVSIANLYPWSEPPDDLTLVVDLRTAEALQGVGVTSLDQLANIDDDMVRSMIEAGIDIDTRAVEAGAQDILVGAPKEARHERALLGTELEDVMRRTMSLIAALAVVTACSGSGGTDPDAGAMAEPGGELLVSAAASLTDAFQAMAVSFQRAHPEVDVVVNTGGSAALREQILQGAPVDVFASASPDVMDDVVEAGETADDPIVFALNRLQIAVPAGNPASVAGIEDFGDGSLLLGVCAAGVPCGDLARQALERAGVVASIDTNEPDVRALLVKVAAGELDAGITYATDVAADPRVEGIDIPSEFNAVASYVIAVLRTAPNPDAGSAFVDYVVSDEGRDTLSSFGFTLP